MSQPTSGGVPGSIGHYQLVRRIGQGGMGMVFEGVDRRDNSRVAIKLLYPHLANDQSFLDRFEREAHVAALLRSPYTVHVLDYGLQEDWYYIVMEFIEGRALNELLKVGPVPPDQALRIASEVARALEEAQARGVTHRDIKPENILLHSGGRAKLADFGIARQAANSNLTVPGGFLGTVYYAAPEQAGGNADHRSDIYALGVTLFAMLAGKPPFTGSAPEIIRQHSQASVPTQMLAHLPDAVVNVVRRCMEKHPADRYQNASELTGALERAQQVLQTWSGGQEAAVPWASSPSFGSQPSQTPIAPQQPGYAPQAPPQPYVPPEPAVSRQITQQPPTQVISQPQQVAPQISSSATAAPSPGLPPVNLPPQPQQSFEPTRIEARPQYPTPAPAASYASQPSAAGYESAASSSGIFLALSQANIPGSSRGWSVGRATVGGAVGQPRPVRIQAQEASGSCEMQVPEVVTIPPSGQAVIDIKMRPRSRRWFGPTERRQFTLVAHGGGGEPPAYATGTFDDKPRGWGVLGPILGFAAALILAPAAIFASGALGGDDDGPPGSAVDGTATAKAGASASPAGASSPSPTATATVTVGPGTPTPEPVPTATPTPTRTPVPVTAPPGVPTFTPTATPTQTPTATATNTPVPPTATRTPTPAPTATPTPAGPTAPQITSFSTAPAGTRVGEVRFSFVDVNGDATTYQINITLGNCLSWNGGPCSSQSPNFSLGVSAAEQKAGANVLVGTISCGSAQTFGLRLIVRDAAGLSSFRDVNFNCE